MRYTARGLIDAANAGHTILAPTAELSAGLVDAVERHHLAAGDAVWPTARIRDIGGWLRELHAERQLADATIPRLLGDVEERELWRAVILDGAAGGDFLEPTGAARSARRARRALIEYGMPQEALARYATDESTALLAWIRNFDARCRDLACMSADELQIPAGGAHAALCWIESPLWRPVARHTLTAAGARLLPATEVSRGAALRRVSVQSSAAELAAIAEWARRALDRDADFRAWISIPDLPSRRTQVVDAFDAALARSRYALAAREQPAPYAIAGGTPLADHFPVRVALDALAAVTGVVSFEAFSGLLRSPELQPQTTDAGAAAALDAALRRRAPHAAPLHEWLALAAGLARETGGSPVAAVELLHSFVRSLDAVRGAHPLSRWVAVWVTALESGPWSQRARWSSTQFQAAERLRELLAALGMGDAVFGRLAAPAAGRVLARAAAETPFQAQTGIPPIWVSGQLMDPWLAYDGLWVARAGEDRWPPPIDPIPLLPVTLQRQYGVIPADALQQLRWAEDLQRRWAARAAENVYSCADSADGGTTSLSTLLPTAPTERLTPQTQPHWRIMQAAAPSLEVLVDERAPAFAAPERLRGIATLRAQSRCAFRGFAETRLRAEPLEKPQPGFNPRERGEMLHHALEYLWSELRTSERLREMGAGPRHVLLEQSATRAVAAQCAQRNPGVKWQSREIPRLERLLDDWLEVELQREPFVVESLELADRSARHGGLEFSVRIDRIDRLSDGSRVLIDYKTGIAAVDWRGERPDNPQLPVYAVLLPENLLAVAYGAVNAGESKFIAETGRGGIFKPRGRPSALEGMPDFAALVDLWSRRIAIIAAEFAEGLAAVTPTLRACESCHLHALCRIPALLDEPVE